MTTDVPAAHPISRLSKTRALYPRTQGSDFVFTNTAGGRLGWLQHGFRKALVRAELTDLHFHDLRHTFASQWMMAGGELYALKDIREEP